MKDRDVIILDHDTFIPEGAEELFYETVFSTESAVEDEESESDVIGNIPMTPTSMTIIKQEMRTAPDGTQVVDVTIETNDIPNVVKYDIRVTKEDI